MSIIDAYCYYFIAQAQNILSNLDGQIPKMYFHMLDFRANCPFKENNAIMNFACAPC